jgi:hypothetical protein
MKTIRKGVAYMAERHSAKKNKSDEFYTRIEDLAAEMRYYKEQFRGKIIFCNCDDPYESNFFKYFAMNFNYLGLKKLIATCYIGSPIANTQLSLFDYESAEEKTTKAPHKIEIVEVDDYNADGAFDLADVEYLLRNKKNVLSRLNGDGDFRSHECIELLKQADVVVTNPPFSLFREYVAQLLEYGKEFVILANQNALTYKEIFPLLRENKMWLGYYCGDMAFTVPAHYEERSTRFWVDEAGQKWRSMGNICWFTNLDTTKRHEFLTLYKNYSPEEFPHFDNYDAINVNKTSDIPCDYEGAMGVPITFVDKYNPEQFEIIDGIGRYSILNNEETKKAGKYLSMVNGKAIYFRYIIKRIGAPQ